MAQGKRLFTGMQPSGQLHIGNYFGALKPTVDLFRDNEGLIMVADYHSLTSLKNGPELRENIIEIVRAYLAAGIDPARATIFKQSDVSEHTELAWIFDCLVTVPFLELGHAYKDKVARGLEANAGLFTYPMLMAADILLYDTDVVPVGEDQRQHVEYAREAAAKFNNAFGETFKEPQEMIQKAVGVVPGTDGKKMSKSYGNTIPLFGTKEEVQKAVMGIVTDSSGTIPKNVYEIHKLFRPDSMELEAVYEKHAGNYKALKEALIDDIESVIAPMREKRNAISDDEVREVLKAGAQKAKAIASQKMDDVRKKVGVAL
jgi:tryptophanyl-tRNA synthetase